MAHNVRPWLAAVIGSTILGGCLDQLYAPPYSLERERITRNTHTDLFPIASGAHTGVDCNACHGAFDTFTQFDCTTTCHEHAQAVTDASHAGLAGYAYGPTTCYDCHPTGTGSISREDHERFFPIKTGNHGGLACASCHVAGAGSFSCIDCHEHAQAATDLFHVGLADYVYGPTTCYACHPTGEGMSRAQHDPYFPIVSGRHGGLSCTTCHPSGYGTFSCIDCHEHLCTSMNPKHNEVGNYSCTSSRCVNCHPRGVAGDD
ncbi:MAG: hypothetical protein A2289_18235 [Deltaproteobacteria bacterium RIFOXYA12_FULL_58_15]|nr:MAG: hypothetical protein A2289_18235 [Deltaproteobacteria bacterium RIFOXYA12_FULL_58_15]